MIRKIIVTVFFALLFIPLLLDNPIIGAAIMIFLSPLGLLFHFITPIGGFEN